LKFLTTPPKDLSNPEIAENSLEIMKKRSFLKNKEGKLIRCKANVLASCSGSCHGS
jgi:hypothetical protein